MINAQNQYRGALWTVTTNASTAVKTANLDTKGSDWATILIQCSTGIVATAGATATISLLSSDDTVVSNFATIVADKTHSSTAAKFACYDVDTKTTKRYLRLSVTPGTTASNDAMVVAADYCLTRSAIEPLAATNISATETIVA